MACIATILRGCFAHRHVVSVIRVVCLPGRLTVLVLSLVWQVGIVLLNVLSNHNGWWWCRFHSRSTSDNAVLCVPWWTLHCTEKNATSCRRDGSSHRIVRENTRPPGVRTMCSSVAALPPTQTPLMNTTSPLCHRFPPCRARCLGLGTLTRTTTRERHDLMSFLLTVGPLACRHPVAPLLVSTDLPARLTQQQCPDRCICAKSFTHCQSASGSPHESSEPVLQQLGQHAQQDWMLNCVSMSSRISQDLPPSVSPCWPEPPLLAVIWNSAWSAGIDYEWMAGATCDEDKQLWRCEWDVR